MKLKVVTPTEQLLDQEVSQVTLPGAAGEMTILPGHTFLLAQLKKGTLRHPGGAVAIGGGFVEVQSDQVLVVAQSAK